jgi:hypothetical protein
MINATISEDTEFNELSVEAQLIYLRTIPHLDRDGLINGHPVVLWGKVAPLMQSLLPMMACIIDEMVNSGLVIRYQQGKTPILFFKGFSKNQSLTHYDREAPSTFTPPPGYYRTNKGLKPLDDDDKGIGPAPDEPKKPSPGASGPTPDQLRTNSGPTPDEVPQKGIERNRKEVEVSANGSEPAQPKETEKTAAAAADDGKAKYADFVKEYENTWGLMLTQYHAEKVKDWCDRVTVTAWSYALKECADHRNVGQWKYFEKILERIEKDGLPDGTNGKTGKKDKASWERMFNNPDEPEYLKLMKQGVRP